MAITDFDFKSPGVQTREEDQSTFPLTEPDPGVIIIGTAPAGPAMQPVIIRNKDTLETIFGSPQSAESSQPSDDTYRYGNGQMPTYGLYAAKAWLSSGESPVTFIRLLGQDSDNIGGSYTYAGWNLGGASFSGNVAANTTAYGIFVMPSASATTNVTGTLAAIVYAKSGAVSLSGEVLGDPTQTTSSACTLIKSVANTNSTTFNIEIWSDQTTKETHTIDLGATTGKGIRNMLSTNPAKINSINYGAALQENYFLGESFEASVKSHVTSINPTHGVAFVAPLELNSGNAANNAINHLRAAKAPTTGWIFNRHIGDHANFDYNNRQKLFKIHSLHEGTWMHNYHVRIFDLNVGSDSMGRSTFGIEVVRGSDSVVERYSNLNLDRSSENYVARRIGNTKLEWDADNLLFNEIGEFPNRSKYIRIEESTELIGGSISDQFKIPWGFYGPARPKGFTIVDSSSGANAFGDTSATGVKATAVLIVDSVTGLTDRTLTIGLPDGTTYTATATTADTSATNIDTDDCASANNFATELQAVLALAQAGGNLRGITVSGVENDGGGNPRKITLTAKETGPDSNSLTLGGTLVDNNNIFVNPTSDLVGNGQGTATFTGGTDTDNVTNIYVKAANTSIPMNLADVNNFLYHRATNLSASFRFPSLNLTTQNTRGSGGSNYQKSDTLGVKHTYAGDSPTGNKGVKFRKDYLDLVKYQVWGVNDDAGTNLEYSFVFSMDEVISDPSFADSGNTARWYYESGSQVSETAYTALSGSRKMTQRGPKAFALPLFGGFDGIDITQVDPFSMRNVIEGESETTNYAYYSIKKAIDMVKDEEKTPATIISYPGLTNSGLLQEIKEVVEDRGDCMAIVDFDDQYKEKYENNGQYDNTGGTVSDILNTSDDFGENMNSNRVAVYFPRVKINDGASLFTAPASVAAIGALAFNDSNSPGPWFAPAGFNRGGLSVLGGPSSGLSVTNTKVNLNKQNRDDLYLEHINPIARFPAVNEIVIFGQKTMSRGPVASTSALSRVNVRRLMIFLHHRIKNVADTVLFEQSVASTFNSFTSRVQRILDSVKSNFGITEYLVELDTEATDENGVELVDKNIMYVKVFIKPARAIEFIAIDFIITRSDAEF